MVRRNLIQEISEKSKVYKDVMIRKSVIGNYAVVGDYAVIDHSMIGEHVEIDRNCYVQDSEISYGTYVRKNSLIKFSQIGKFCNISWNVSIGGSNHDYKNPSLYTSYWWKRVFDVEICRKENDSCVDIGNDVWISAGVNIIRGVKIGNGAVIGAGAVITKDVEPYTIVVGAPGRMIGKRFEDEVIERLQLLKWWEWPTEIIKENAYLLSTELTLDTLSKMEDVSRSVF